MNKIICKISSMALIFTMIATSTNGISVYADENNNDSVIDDISIDKQGQTVDVYYDYYGEYAKNPQDLFTISIKAHDNDGIQKVEVEITSPEDEEIENNEQAYSGVRARKTNYKLNWNESTQSYQGVVHGLYSYRPSMHNAYISSVTITDNAGNDTYASESLLYDTATTDNVTHFDPKYWVRLDMYHDVSLREWNEITGQWDYRTTYLKDGTTLEDINNMFKPENDIAELGFEGWQYIYGTLEEDYPIRCGFSLIAQYNKNIVEFDTLSTKDGKYRKNYIRSQYVRNMNEIVFPKIAGYKDSDWQEVELAPDDVNCRYVLSTDKEISMSDEEINSYVDTIDKCNDGDIVTIEMGDTLFVPYELLAAIEGKDVTTIFDMDGIKWSLNGKDILTDSIRHDVNASIVKSICENEPSTISDLLGTYKAEKIELGDDEAFDIGASLTVASNLADNRNKVVLMNKEGDNLEPLQTETLTSTEYDLNRVKAGIIYSVYGVNGDCTGDDKIDIKDALKALNHVSGRTEMNVVQQEFADIDMNNKVNLQDLTRLIHYVSGRTSVLYEENKGDGTYDGGGSGQGGSISNDYAPGSGNNPSGTTGVEGADVVDYAKQFVGNPYIWGGNSLTDGCDSSGFVHEVFSHFGISTPRYSQAFKSVGNAVSFDYIQPGDVVVYPGHIAIYAGNGKIVEAQSTKAGITCERSVQCHTILAIRRLV